MHFKTETILRPDDMQDNCERCGKELDDLYERGSPVYDLIVLKCPQCKAIYAYFIDYSKDDYLDMDYNTEPKNDHSAPLKKSYKKINGKKIRLLSKHCVVIYSNGIAEQEKRNKELNDLMQNRLSELYKIGLSIATINFARAEVVRCIKKNTTANQIRIMFAAAVYAKANSITTDSGLWEHKGEGATVRQLEKIFGVSRKTISKWADKFNNPI